MPAVTVGAMPARPSGREFDKARLLHPLSAPLRPWSWCRQAFPLLAHIRPGLLTWGTSVDLVQ